MSPRLRFRVALAFKRVLAAKALFQASKESNWPFAKKWSVIHAPRAPRSVDAEGLAETRRGTCVVGLSCFLSREPREVYSEVVPRRPASTWGPGAFHGDYHIACHIVGAPHEGAKEDGGGASEGRRRTHRTRTLTTSQYSWGHGVYKPPQFYLRSF